MSVIDSFQDKSSKPALLRYLELHKNFPDREFYVVHSEREHLDIKEHIKRGLEMIPQYKKNDGLSHTVYNHFI